MNQAKPRNWFGRNWKWFVPVGCLTIILAVVAFMLVLVFFVFGMMKSSEAYQQGVAKAKVHAAVVDALGSPIHEGFFVSGSTNVTAASGSASLAVPLSGPKGSGTLYVEASKSAGEWEFEQLLVEVDANKARIDLLAPAE